MTFECWWKENEAQYSRDSLHMSEFHMAKVVWDAATSLEREECAKIADNVNSFDNPMTPLGVVAAIRSRSIPEPQKEEPEIIMWLGRDIKELSNDELIDAFSHLVTILGYMRKQNER